MHKIIISDICGHVYYIQSFVYTYMYNVCGKILLKEIEREVGKMVSVDILCRKDGWTLNQSCLC